jgi:DNA-binding response OmpR family regulator
LHAKTLLLVEDDVASAHPLSILLRRQGWAVHAVTTLAAANRYLDTQVPDSIILDLMLPDGEGSTILDRVRRNGLAIKVTVTTASADPDRLDAVRALRPDALLTKPLNLAELLRVI